MKHIPLWTRVAPPSWRFLLPFVILACLLATGGAQAQQGERDGQRKTKRAAKVERFIAAEPELPRGEASPAPPQGAVPRLIKFSPRRSESG